MIIQKNTYFLMNTQSSRNLHITDEFCRNPFTLHFKAVTYCISIYQVNEEFAQPFITLHYPSQLFIQYSVCYSLNAMAESCISLDREAKNMVNFYEYEHRDYSQPTQMYLYIYVSFVDFWIALTVCHEASYAKQEAFLLC